MFCSSPYCSAYFLTHTNVHTIKHTGKSRSQITSSQSFLGEIPWNFNKLYTTMLTLEERITTFNWISMDGYRRNSCFPLIITVFRFKIKNHLCLDILVFFFQGVCMCVSIDKRMPWYTQKGQRTTTQSQSLPPTSLKWELSASGTLG